MARDASARPMGAGLTIHLKLSKRDQSVEEAFSRLSEMDSTPGTLLSAVAVREMLIGDPHERPGELVPLLRDPRHGGELRYGDSLRYFKEMARITGLPELALGLHSLRMRAQPRWLTLPRRRAGGSGSRRLVERYYVAVRLGLQGASDRSYHSHWGRGVGMLTLSRTV